MNTAARQSIHATNSGDNFTTMNDIVLLMYILYGIKITRTMKTEYDRWRTQGSWQLNVMSDEEYRVEKNKSMDEAQWWMKRMYILTMRGLGSVPANFLDSSRHSQSTQERFNVLHQIPDLTENQKCRVLLHFDRLYGVQRIYAEQPVQQQ